MSSTSRAWAVAASVGAVEALKDQHFCRWNYAFRLLKQRANTNFRSYAQAKKLSPAAAAAKRQLGQKAKQSEESLRTVVYLSCIRDIQVVGNLFKLIDRDLQDIYGVVYNKSLDTRYNFNS